MHQLFQYAHHLGFYNPYYYKEDQKFWVEPKFESIIAKNKTIKTVNPKALLSFFNKFYFLGDDCVINEIKRSPWMAKPEIEKAIWSYYQLPRHQNKSVHEEEVADQLFDLLCEEIKDYVGEAKSVGILLSGGMDSRMVAGCLYHMISNKKINVDRVVAYTWGNKDSRDHIYAKGLAKDLDWEFKDFQVGADEMWENFMISGKRGCEYSGLHLHAMPQIAKCNDVDVILAGSYGDSVGRAEYSLAKVNKLKPIEKPLKNKAGLLNTTIFKQTKTSILSDIDKYHQIFKTEKIYQQNEIDRQLHYMRRMLNPCMEVINDKTPLFQIFTSPKVFGYMWSLDVSLRNDKVYYYLLKKFSDKISQVPWARTGKRFMEVGDKPDQHNKKHHNYSDIVQFQLYDTILNYVNDHSKLLSYVNMKAFNVIMKEIKNYPKHNFDYLEVICWMVSYTNFMLTYQDLIEKPKPFNSSALALKAKLEYRTITRLRNLKNNI